MKDFKNIAPNKLSYKTTITALFFHQVHKNVVKKTYSFMILTFLMLGAFDVCSQPVLTLNGSDNPHPLLENIYFAEATGIDAHCIDFSWTVIGGDIEYIPNDPRAVKIKWNDILPASIAVQAKTHNSQCTFWQDSKSIDIVQFKDKTSICAPSIDIRFNCQYGYAYVVINPEHYQFEDDPSQVKKICKDGETFSLKTIQAPCIGDVFSYTVSYSNLSRTCAECEITTEAICESPITH